MQDAADRQLYDPYVPRPTAARSLLLPLQAVSPPRGARGVPRNYTVWNAPPAGLSIGDAAFKEKVVVGGPATKNKAAMSP